ncbi:MAG: hypothetical protein GKR89_03325 [Candidatus Latescibacteria bacterium]|nr:hypothetical protein [Candidatus Latescibacterota bacterium]
MDISLRNSSGDARVDRILCAQIGLCELMFPDLIRGYYVTGSYARGQALPNSDVDFYVIFKVQLDDADQEKVRSLSQYCYQLDPLKGGFSYRCEPIRGTLDIAQLPYSLHVFGEDIKDVLPKLTLITICELN